MRMRTIARGELKKEADLRPLHLYSDARLPCPIINTEGP